MTNGDYFFLIFLGTIAVTRLFLIKKIAAPTIGGFRVRHYMYGIVLLPLALWMGNVTIYAIGCGLFVDELSVALVKGSGHKSEYWNGCEDYHSAWSVAGTLIFIFLVFVFRDTISGLL